MSNQLSVPKPCVHYQRAITVVVACTTEHNKRQRRVPCLLGASSYFPAHPLSVRIRTGEDKLSARYTPGTKAGIKPSAISFYRMALYNVKEKRLATLLPWVESHRYTAIESKNDPRCGWRWRDMLLSRTAAVGVILLSATMAGAYLSQNSFRSRSSSRNMSSSGGYYKGVPPPLMMGISSSTLASIDGGIGNESSELLLSYASAAATAESAEEAAAAATETATSIEAAVAPQEEAAAEASAAEEATPPRPPGALPAAATATTAEIAPAATRTATNAAAAAAALLLDDIRVRGHYSSSSSNVTKHHYTVGYPWEHVAEPYRTTVMEAKGSSDNNNGESRSNGFNLR